MYVFAVFLNRNEVMQFITLLKRNRVISSMVSAPKGLGGSCSVAVKFFLKDIDIAKKLLYANNFKTFSNFFKLKNKNNHAVFEAI